MNKLNININFFYNCVLDNTFGSESIRFHDEEKMYKIIYNKYLKDDRQEIIEKLSRINHENLATPIDALYEKRKFIGYSMEYLDNYIHIGEYLSRINGFQNRKDFLLYLSSVFDYFDSINYAYYDIHEDNILCKDDNFKIIDLDGGVFKDYKNNNLDYNASIRLTKKNLTKFILMMLYNINEYDLIILKKNQLYRNYKILYNELPYQVKELYDYVLNNDYYLYYNLTTAIKEIEPSMMEETKEIILKKKP